MPTFSPDELLAMNLRLQRQVMQAEDERDAALADVDTLRRRLSPYELEAERAADREAPEGTDDR